MDRLEKIGQIIVWILGAILVYSLLGKLAPPLIIVFNPFTWVVLYFSLVRHEVYGAVVGTICGLVQDAFSFGIFGVGGLTKTLLGFSAGLVARKINVLPPGRNFLFLFLLATAELLLWKAVVIFLFGEKPGLLNGYLLAQPLATASVVAVLFQLIGRRKEEVV